MNEFNLKLGNEELIVSTGKLAKQADGSVTVQYGGTMVLVTSVCSRQPREGLDFFPLTVEYQEKTFAAGKIPGGFFKREGRPSQKAILTSRMIDRPIRPLFPEGMTNEVQVVATVLSSDGKNDSDILGVIGASTALTISDIPFNGPIGCVRVGLVEDNFVINPTFAEMEKSDLDLVVVGNDESVVMLESGANELSEEKMVEAIKFGHEQLKPQLDLQRKLAEKIGKPKREDISYVEVNEELYQRIKEKAQDKLKQIMQLSEKQQRVEGLADLQNKLVEEEGSAEDEDIESDVKRALHRIEKDVLRQIILEENKRVDGRRFDEIRQISSEINALPRTHGSGLFTRGETQALAVTTLGTAADEQRVDSLEGESFKSFMLHYNFPPFSVGDVRPMRGPGRREIGHGALAEKALTPVIPSKEEFPYTIRLVSEILESNGSSSMASVCAGSLSLMASGVPVKAAVSGIAMGLVKEETNYAILTDIAGAEDHFGDMDFKVAGTKDGVTAVQMDLKIKGIDFDILKNAFEQAKAARMKILDNMTQTIPEPLNEIAPNAPRIVTLTIKPDKIRDVIGSGGKVIRGIIAETGADINIEDDGTCQVASSDKESLDKAIEIIEGIIEEPEIGKVYDATVVNITNFGAFVEFLPKKEGLVHVSELSKDYVKEVTDVVKEGDKVKVKLIGIDDQGRVKLSMKQVEEDKS
ncbi:MAG: polyribonucleotide nucleotidyltransferase [Candidatus Omnitrophica bacterium]|nr:polyribonucleotide nucleotidyltransferase [Candidatus Omnitrophota bacterium]